MTPELLAAWIQAIGGGLGIMVFIGYLIKIYIKDSKDIKKLKEEQK